ncbi:MAG: hypothetical protein AAGC93_05735, partial [Cyanobacteria bacterium P01_F01_bin.53]
MTSTNVTPTTETLPKKREDKSGSLWRLWGVLVAMLLALWATLLLTRPAADTLSMTPLSGLMTLKSMAAESMPYETAIANQKPT